MALLHTAFHGRKPDCLVRISTTVNHTDSQRTLEQLEKNKKSIYGIVETWRKHALSSTFHGKSGMIDVYRLLLHPCQLPSSHNLQLFSYPIQN